jgi:hypothetical protein
MAFLEQRGDRSRLLFRHAGRRYTHTLKTTDEIIAEGLKGGIEKTLMLLDQKVLRIPDGVDVLSFIIGNGEVKLPEAKPTDGSPAKPQPDLTLRELRDQYLAAHAVGGDGEELAGHCLAASQALHADLQRELPGAVAVAGETARARQSPGEEEGYPQATAQPRNHPPGSCQLACCMELGGADGAGDRHVPESRAEVSQGRGETSFSDLAGD